MYTFVVLCSSAEAGIETTTTGKPQLFLHTIDLVLSKNGPGLINCLVIILQIVDYDLFSEMVWGILGNG